MAERYPARADHRRVQLAVAAELHRRSGERAGSRNVQVVTADMNDFAPDGRFDRVVSVEMFEHMRNYEALLARIATWTITWLRCSRTQIRKLGRMRYGSCFQTRMIAGRM